MSDIEPTIYVLSAGQMMLAVFLVPFVMYALLAIGSSFVRVRIGRVFRQLKKEG